jgi:hypothetical protein
MAAAAASLLGGSGVAYANGNDDEDRNDQSYQTPSSDQADQNTTDQGYDRHWFSATGYGPHDEQADQTRALNNEQLGHGGEVDQRGDDRDDMQGPADDDAAPADDDDDDDDDRAPPPDDR